MYEVKFSNVGPDRLNWTAPLKTFGAREVIQHLATRGIHLPVECEDSFSAWPEEDGTIEGVISQGAKVIGLYSARPLRKDEEYSIADVEDPRELEIPEWL